MNNLEAIVRKIPFFQRLSPTQVSKVLQIGRMRNVPEGQSLCKEDDNSVELYILIAGELAIKNCDVELARVRPVDIVGEMGVVTNQPRCATIEVIRPATLLAIPKLGLDALLKSDPDVASRIYKNMLVSLCTKLRQNNEVLTESQTSGDRRIAASVV